MLSLLYQNPTKSHARSATLPNSLDPSGTANQHQSQSQNHETGALHHVNGQGSVLSATIPQSTLLPPDSRTHQRSRTDTFGSSRDLPPLLISQPDPLFSTTCEFDPFAQANFSNSPDSSRQQSPTRSRRSINTDSSKSGNKPKTVSSWFQGESHPIKVGLVPSPTKEKANPLHKTLPITTAPGFSSGTHTTSSPQTSQKLAMASRFSFFNSKASLAKSLPSSGDHIDEMADLDVNVALFPSGPPDPFSPAAFKNLQQQAEGVLSRLQAAYKERAVVLRDMVAEKEALSEETQGAETRARHLKLQLDAMGQQLADQDKAMMNMVDELAQEKLARREEEEIRKRSVRLVERDFTPSSAPRTRPRRSINSDSGFESEDESSVESVFSKRDGTHSPTMSMSSVSTDNSPDTLYPREILNPPTQAARLRIPPMAAKPNQQACTNCHGIRASDAWLVVGVLKEENQGLKERVGELEAALDGCLDVVGGLGG